jgi:hypothetical protein
MNQDAQAVTSLEIEADTQERMLDVLATNIQQQLLSYERLNRMLEDFDPSIPASSAANKYRVASLFWGVSSSTVAIIPVIPDGVPDSSIRVEERVANLTCRILRICVPCIPLTTFGIETGSGKLFPGRISGVAVPNVTGRCVEEFIAQTGVNPLLVPFRVFEMKLKNRIPPQKGLCWFVSLGRERPNVVLFHGITNRSRVFNTVSGAWYKRRALEVQRK